jgi:hypothetical protein
MVDAAGPTADQWLRLSGRTATGRTAIRPRRRDSRSAGAAVRPSLLADEAKLVSVQRFDSRAVRGDEAEAEAAHEILAAHVSDRTTGLCQTCRSTGPCWSANAAANRLVELGRRVLDPEGLGRRAGWRGRLTQRATPRTVPPPTLRWHRWFHRVVAEAPDSGPRTAAPQPDRSIPTR